MILQSDQMSNKSSVKSQKYLDPFADFTHVRAPSLSNSIDYSSMNTPSENVNRAIRSQVIVRDSIRHNTLMLAPIMEESKVMSHCNEDNFTTNDAYLNNKKMRASTVILNANEILETKTIQN